jgi:hypothetical protein
VFGVAGTARVMDTTDGAAGTTRRSNSSSAGPTPPSRPGRDRPRGGAPAARRRERNQCRQMGAGMGVSVGAVASRPRESPAGRAGRSSGFEVRSAGWGWGWGWGDDTTKNGLGW